MSVSSVVRIIVLAGKLLVNMQIRTTPSRFLLAVSGNLTIEHTLS